MGTRARWLIPALLCALGGCATVRSVTVEPSDSLLLPGQSLVGSQTRVLSSSADSAVIELAVRDEVADSLLTLAFDGPDGGVVVACFLGDLSREELQAIDSVFGTSIVDDAPQSVRETRYPFVQRRTARGRRVLELKVAEESLPLLSNAELALGIAEGSEDSVNACATDRAVERARFAVQEEDRGPHMVIGGGIMVLIIAVTGTLGDWWF